METLESSRVCRLCGKHSGISINIFDKNENHVKKINAVLPIMVHEMDLLPKHMCHCCSYKLEEFHKFYAECLRTDANLKSQLSWMRKEEGKEHQRVTRGAPMVHIENLKIKVEPADYEVYELEPIVEDVGYINSLSSVSFPVNGVRNGMSYPSYARCKYCCDKTDQSGPRRRRRPSFEALDEREDCDVGSSSDAVRPKQAVKRDPSPWESPTLLRPPARRQKPPAEAEPRASTTVRNLRPRKGPIDYGGPARKSKPQPSFAPTSSIKMERLDDFEGGRVLRPRKAIDYMESRRYTRTRVKRERLAATEVDEHARSRVLELLEYSEAAVRVKQEPPDEFGDSLPPEKMLASLNGESVDRVRHKRHASLARMAKRRRSKSPVPQRRKPAEVRFVNGSAKRLEGGRIKSERLRRSVRCTAGQKAAAATESSVANASRTAAAPFKLVDSVKQYCEKCNVSFAHKELYRLHACYV